MQAFEDEAAAGKRGQAVEQLHRFLHLNAGDDGRDRRRSGHFAFGDILVRQQVARHAALQNGPIDFAERAFVAGSRAGKKDAGDAVDAFDGAVDPRAIHFPRGAIDPQAGFAIVEPGENQIAGGEEAEAALARDIRDDGLQQGIGRDGKIGAGGGVHFKVADVALAKQNGARKIRFVDLVHVHDDDVAEAKQREVFQDFIAKRAGADDEHARRCKLFLVPPGNQPEAAVAIFVEIALGNGGHGRARAQPAVISGCRRRMSPSCTWASARVCVS